MGGNVGGVNNNKSVKTGNTNNNVGQAQAEQKIGTIQMVNNPVPQVEGQLRQDMGNGTTKIINPDGTVAYECDYANGYNGVPLLVEKGTDVRILNAPKNQKQTAQAGRTEIKDPSFLDSLRHFASSGRTLGERVARGIISVAGLVLAPLGVLQSCNTIQKEHNEELTEAFEKLEPKVEIVNGEITDAELTKLEKDIINDLFNALNKQMADKGASEDGSLQYDYVYDGSKNGEIRFKNPDGTYSDLRLGFELEFGQRYDENTDEKTGDYTAKVNLTAKPLSPLTGKNVVDYIGILGETFDKDGVAYEFSSSGSNANVSVKNGTVTITKSVGDTNTKPVDVVGFINSFGEELTTSEGVPYSFEVNGDKVKVNFGNGFSCNIGDDVSVKSNKPLGAAQQMLFDLGIISENPDGVITHTNTAKDAFSGEKNGVSFEVLPGDLNEITNGNPTVKMSIGDLEVQGKLSVENGVVTITAADGKKLTLTPGNVEFEKNVFFPGASVSYDGKEVLRMAKDNFGGKDAVTFGKVIFNDENSSGYVESRTHYCPEELETFNGEASQKEAKDYYDDKDKTLIGILTDANTEFEKKKQELQTEYNNAVAALNKPCDLFEPGQRVEVKPDGTTKLVADAEGSVTWKWGL